MSRSTRRLIQSGSTIVAVLAMGLGLPTSAHAAGATALAPAKHSGAHGTCTAHRRPVSIAPRMIDNIGGPSRGTRSCR
jgi:hypothetical protein